MERSEAAGRLSVPRGSLLRRHPPGTRASRFEEPSLGRKGKATEPLRLPFNTVHTPGSWLRGPDLSQSAPGPHSHAAGSGAPAPRSPRAAQPGPGGELQPEGEPLAPRIARLGAGARQEAPHMPNARASPPCSRPTVPPLAAARRPSPGPSGGRGRSWCRLTRSAATARRSSAPRARPACRQSRPTRAAAAAGAAGAGARWPVTWGSTPSSWGCTSSWTAAAPEASSTAAAAAVSSLVGPRESGDVFFSRAPEQAENICAGSRAWLTLL